MTTQPHECGPDGDMKSAPQYICELAAWGQKLEARVAELEKLDELARDAYQGMKAERDRNQARVADLEATNVFQRSTLLRCIAHAGLPDPATGCRAIIATVKEALSIP